MTSPDDNAIPEPDDGPDAEVVPFPGHAAGPTAESDTSFEVPLDDEPEDEPEPVDDGYGYALDDEPDLYPVIPENLRSLEAVRGTLARTGSRAGHHAAFHGVRTPAYLVLMLFWAGVGVFRLAGRQLSWWWVMETDTLRSGAAASGDAREWMRLHKEAKETRLIRGLVLGGEVTALLIAVLVLAVAAPWWGQALAVAVAVPALARIGRPEDRPIISRTTTEPRFRVISADAVLRAYYAAGLGNPDKPDQRVGFESTMSHDGTGSKVKVVLPYGKGFHDVVKALPALASGLDVAPSQVYLTKDKKSHRRHTMWVADQDPLAVPAGRTPLLDCKRRSVWAPAPFGLDERGRKVTLLLLWISILIGAQPRKGKTFSGRLLALYAALDPTVRQSIVDGKNSPDWTAFRQIAYHYIHGIVPGRDGDPIEQLISALSEIKAHILSTNEFLAGLPVEECPEGKLTEELCRRYPDRLFVWMLVMEEFQVYFELADQKANAAIADLLSFIQAVGPSAGVILVALSQKPSGVGAGDVGRLFNRFRDLLTVRFALKCGNRDVSVAILGGDAYAEGFDASTLPIGKDTSGSATSTARPTRPPPSAPTSPTQKTPPDRGAARVLRERAGTISGFAAGQDTGIPARNVLADVLAVFGADSGLHWTVLAERLAGQLPDRWADATAEAVSAQCRDLGVPSVDVRYPSSRAGRVRVGCRRADVETAAGR